MRSTRATSDADIISPGGVRERSICCLLVIAPSAAPILAFAFPRPACLSLTYQWRTSNGNGEGVHASVLAARRPERAGEVRYLEFSLHPLHCTVAPHQLDRPIPLISYTAAPAHRLAGSNYYSCQCHLVSCVYVCVRRPYPCRDPCVLARRVFIIDYVRVRACD